MNHTQQIQIRRRRRRRTAATTTTTPITTTQLQPHEKQQKVANIRLGRLPNQYTTSKLMGTSFSLHSSIPCFHLQCGFMVRTIDISNQFNIFNEMLPKYNHNSSN